MMRSTHELERVLTFIHKDERCYDYDLMADYDSVGEYYEVVVWLRSDLHYDGGYSLRTFSTLEELQRMLEDTGPVMA